jgi:hypothetical protein
MAECWEAYSLNKNVDTLDEHSFASYRLALIKNSDSAHLSGQELNSGAVVSRPSLTGNKRAADTSNTAAIDSNGLASVTPPAKRFNVTFDDATARYAVDAVASSNSGNRRISLSPAHPGSLAESNNRLSKLPKYGERQGAGKVLLIFNPSKLEAMQPSETTAVPKCVVSTKEFATANVQESYRHMFTPLEDRAKALDGHLVTLGEDIVERYGLGKQDEQNETGIASLESVGVPRQDKVCCIGRICNTVSYCVVAV